MPITLALLDDYLPHWMNEAAFAGLTTAQWIGLAVILAAALLAGILVERLVFAVGQLIYGPISDMFGRKPPLYFGIGIFLVQR